MDYLYWVIGFKTRGGITIDMIIDYEDGSNISRPLKRDAVALLKRYDLIEAINVNDYDNDIPEYIYDWDTNTNYIIVEGGHFFL